MDFDPNGGWARLAIAVAALVVAWAISRLSRRLAERVSARLERRRATGEESPADTAAMVSLKRYDTTVSLVHTTIRYIAFAIALASEGGTALPNIRYLDSGEMSSPNRN